MLPRHVKEHRDRPEEQLAHELSPRGFAAPLVSSLSKQRPRSMGDVVAELRAALANQYVGLFGSEIGAPVDLDNEGLDVGVCTVSRAAKIDLFQPPGRHGELEHVDVLDTVAEAQINNH